MALILPGVSRTFNEFLLLPNRTSAGCAPGAIDLSATLARHTDGEPSPLTLSVPFTSAIMQAVSSPELAISLARCGGLAFLSHNQDIGDQAAAVRQVKTFKAGFVVSDTNVRPDDTLGDLLRVMAATGHSTAAVTEDGTSRGRLAGLITSRDFHPDRHERDTPVAARMVPAADLACGPAAVTLPEADTRLWEERLDCLPLVDGGGRIDAARAYLQCSKHEKAYLALRAAEQIAPEEITGRRAARDVVVALATTALPSIQRQAADFGHRIGIAL